MTVNTSSKLVVKKRRNNDIEHIVAGAKDRKNILRIRNFLEELSRTKEELSRTEQLILSHGNNKESTWRTINKSLTNIIIKGEKVTTVTNDTIINKEIKKKFRSDLAHLLYQGEVINRGYTKPRGYAGDYKVIEMFYDQIPLVQDGIGCYFDRYVLSNSLAKADIGRKDKMGKLIQDFINSSPLKQIRMLNLGCGGCKELRDLFKFYTPTKKVGIIAIDQDKEALDYSKSFALNWPQTVRASFINENIIKLLNRYRNNELGVSFKNQHLAYSIGLVDYFSDNVLKLFVGFCLRAISPGGQFIFAHKNSKRQNSFLAADWLCDWRFYQRDKEMVLNIIKDEIQNCDLKIEWEKTHHMFFIILTKRV